MAKRQINGVILHNMMSLTILGNNSALPAYGRHPTAQILNCQEQFYLIDCGEGTQMRLSEYGFKASRINHIFISHAHGDHYLGLVGLISSQSLLGRVRPLFVYAPPEIKPIIDIQLPWDLGFPLEFIPLQPFETYVFPVASTLEVTAFPVYHSVPTHGFVFREKKRRRKLIPEKVRAYDIPQYFYRQLCEGHDYELPDGAVIKNEWVTEQGPEDPVYAYCADTRYAEEILPHIQGVHLLYHEATYLNDNIEKAKYRCHSTAEQAATLASKAGVHQLLIGHFSSKYRNLEPFLHEARNIFPQTELALEGTTFQVHVPTP